MVSSSHSSISASAPALTNRLASLVIVLGAVAKSGLAKTFQFPFPAASAPPGRCDVGNDSPAVAGAGAGANDGALREKCRGTGLGGSGRSSSASWKSSSSTVISDPDTGPNGAGAVACSSAHAPTRLSSDPRLLPPYDAVMTPTGESLSSLSAYLGGRPALDRAEPVPSLILLPPRPAPARALARSSLRAYASRPGWQSSMCTPRDASNAPCTSNTAMGSNKPAGPF